MLPQGIGTISGIRQEMPAKTYQIDLEKKRITGMVDGLDAIEQAVFLCLHSERFAHVIYSFSYGSELERLFGKEKSYVETEATRYIEEALLADDRITGVKDFRFQWDTDSVFVSFTVMTRYGDFESEVGLHV